MKFRFFTLLLICLAFISTDLYAQPTEWTTSEPGGQGNDIVFTKEETTVSEGTYAAKIDLYSTGTPYIYSAEFDVTEGADYTFSIDVFDNTLGAQFKVYCEFLDASDGDIYGETPVWSSNSADWQTITWSSTVPTGAVKGYVWLKVYDSTGYSEPETLYLDNASYTEDAGNLVPNGSFEEWVSVAFQSYSFEELDPAVNGVIDLEAQTVNATVPYGTDVTALVATFGITDGASAKVGATDQVSGTTPNDFTDPVVYELTKEATSEDWTVTVTVEDPSDEKQISSFLFAALDPEVYGEIDEAAHTISAAVPTGTSVTALVPTIRISEFASVSPESGVAQDFTNPVTYTVTAQDGSTQDYVVTVTETDEVVLFQEFFEGVPRLIPEGFTLIENDNYTPNPGDERWADSAWVIANSSRPEWAGNNMAIALSYYTDMPAEGRQMIGSYCHL
jgi:hypothetical protein